MWRLREDSDYNLEEKEGILRNFIKDVKGTVNFRFCEQEVEAIIL